MPFIQGCDSTGSKMGDIRVCTGTRCLMGGGGGGGEAGILSIVQTLYTDIITGINCPLVLLIKKTIYIIITSIYLSLFFRRGGGGIYPIPSYAYVDMICTSRIYVKQSRQTVGSFSR